MEDTLLAALAHSPAEGVILSHALMRMTAPSTEGAKEISPLRRRGGGRSPSGSFAVAVWKPSPPAGGNSWQVAAALSAAVTTTKQQEYAPNSQAEPIQQMRTRQAPAALRERGVWGERGFSQRSRLSPQNLPTCNLFGREREGGGFSLEKPPPSQLTCNTF